jgi:asparagine synthase (glutamine-hydrolysing)
MCGITGVVQPAGASAPLEAMNATMQHRGPDDRGVVWSPDGRVGLAQCRLAILDLSPGGHQPMSDASGEVWITFNGEIYNFRELRTALEERGHHFRSASDTEVVIESYREWGEDFVKHLNGMFALALYDSRVRRVVLARDRAGEKPLFYRIAGGRMTFASELKALMADPAFPRRVDLRSLDFYLAYGYVPRELCIFEGVKKLRAAEILTYDIDTGTTRSREYWHLPEPPSIIAPAGELERELEGLLEDSVRRQLVADVPVGVLLSGGVDSSLITALAARVSSRPVKTFTISFPGHGASDEGPFARMVASYFGTDHTEMPAEPATVDLLPLIARQYDEPMADSSAIPTYLLSRLVRNQAKVALGGDGGDELFGGYPHYSWLLREERLRSYVPAPARQGAGWVAAHLVPVGTRGRNHAIGLAHDTGYSIAQINVYFDRLTRSRLLRAYGFSPAEAQTPERYRESLSNPRHSVVRRGTETDFMTTMTDAYLVKVDRASMLNSLEIRAPFLDHRLIDFAFGRVPDVLKATESERKILLRRVAGRLLPPALDLTRKQGFSMPLGTWFRGEWGTYIEKVLREGHSFDRPTVDSILRGQRKGRENTARLYALVMFELWRREYNVVL